MTKTQKNFLKGAAILAVSGVICKVIGAVFRIPLANIIGELGMGNYQIAYPIYALLLVVSTAGLPTAISKMVSERIAVGDYRGANYIFRAAFRILVIIGVISAVLMAALSGVIARAIGQETATFSILAIAPALFFVAILSAYRGYFQGMQMMTPTASSQLVEQVGKLAVGLALAGALMQYGPEYGAAGALIGVAASELAALVLVMGFYRRKKPEIYAQMKAAPKIPKSVSFRSTCKQIAKIAVPVTLGACIMPLVSAIDSAIVIRCLTNINYTVDEATRMFGMLTGYVNPLINMPAAISLALAMSLVPAISEARAAENRLEVQNRSATGFRLALLIGLPCALGFAFLADPILRLLYPTMGADTLTTTAELLTVMSFGVLFLTMLQTMTGVLQGLGKVTIPVINLAIGAAVKLVVSLTLTQQPQINIMGAAIGTLSCYAVASILDIIMVIKYSRMRFKLLDYVIKPVFCGGVMTVVVLFVYKALCLKSNMIACLTSIVVGAIIYIALLFILRALRPEDMSSIPGGGKITALMRKLHIWR